MVAIDISAPPAPTKQSDELQHLLQNMSLKDANGAANASLKDANGGAAGDGGPSRKMRTREIASRYKAATISSAAAAEVTAQQQRRYQSPSRARSPSPNLGRSTPLPEISAPKRAISADRRPLSVERRRPWPPAAAAENKTNSAIDAAKLLSSRRLPGRGVDGLWPSTNSLSSSVQSDASTNSSSNGPVDGRLNQESEACDHTLKPTQNGAHKPSDSISGDQQNKAQERKGTTERKGTPERRRTPLRRQTGDQAENAKPFENLNSKLDQQRWPGISNGRSIMSKSMDLTLEKESRVATLLVPSRYRSASKAEDKSIALNRTLSRSINEGSNPNVVRRIALDNKDSKESENSRRAADRDCFGGSSERNGSVREGFREEEEIGSSINAIAIDENVSDTESSSSGGSVALSIASGGGGGSRGPGRGTSVPARFWQDMTSRMGRAPESMRSFVAESEGGKLARRSKAPPAITNGLAAAAASGGLPSSTWAIPPGRAARAGSPTPKSPLSPSSQARSFQPSSPSRGWASPTRTRVAQPIFPPSLSLNGRPGSVAGLLNLGVDARRSRKGLSQQEEAHDLRLLHNRWLQWRFVNARSEVAINTQKVAAENLVYNACLRISDLRLSVATKQTQWNKVRQALKLDSVLSSHAKQLEECEYLQQEHSTALIGVVKALEAAVMRVPLIEGAKVDMQAMKEALGSAIDVMNAVDSSVSKVLPKAEVADSLLSELAKTVILERAFLEECGDLLVAAAALEAEERSLIAYLIQMEHEKSRHVDSDKAASNSVLVR